MRFTIGNEVYDVNRLTFGEMAAFEKVTGQSFQAAAASGSALAMQAFVWLGLKRRQPTLRFADTDDMALDDITFDLDEADGEVSTDPPAGPDGAGTATG